MMRQHTSQVTEKKVDAAIKKVRKSNIESDINTY